MVRVNLRGIHRVKMRLSDGQVREYHYAWRGKDAPRFWDSASGIKVGSAQYLAALTDCTPRAEASKGLFRSAILAFTESQDFSALAPRTQSDILKSIRHVKNGIDMKFGKAPIAAFNDPRVRASTLEWRDSIGGKVGDDRIRHLQRIVSFAIDRRMIHQHHLRDIRSAYKSNRSEIFWTPGDNDAFKKGALDHVWRFLSVALETGLRQSDLLLLSRQHVHRTPHGRRIVIWTQKRKRMASIPVTGAMGDLIDATPINQERLLVNKAGRPYQHENYLGDAVSSWRDKLGIRSEVRLYDARGTAATRLLEAGADLKEIATHMGWSINHASEVIERYVALSPATSDGLAKKPKQAESGTTL